MKFTWYGPQINISPVLQGVEIWNLNFQEIKQGIIFARMWLGVINMSFLLLFWDDYHASLYNFNEAYRFTLS